MNETEASGIVGFMGSDDPENYPLLGRYYKTDFFADNEFWEKAKETFTEDEHRVLDNKLYNPYKAKYLLFANSSRKAMALFSLLLCSGESFRVFPTDDHITKPAVGWIGFDRLIYQERSLRKHLEAMKQLGDRISEIGPKFMFGQMIPIHIAAERKINLIRQARAIKDMAAIATPQLVEDFPTRL